MKPYFVAICLFTVFSFFPLIASIEVEDTKGRKMTIDVLAFTQSSGNVKIKRVSDGSMFTVKLEMFNKASQEAIKKVAPKAKAKLDVKVTVAKKQRDVKGSYYMERQTITAKINIENESRDVDLTKAKGTMFLVGRAQKRYADSDQDYGKILHKESFSANAKPFQSMTYETKPFTTEYDQDRDYTNLGGWKYYGWMLVLQEEDGSVHSVRTSIGNLKKEVDAYPELGKTYLALKAGQVVQKNLAKKPSN